MSEDQTKLWRLWARQIYDNVIGNVLRGAMTDEELREAITDYVVGVESKGKPGPGLYKVYWKSGGDSLAAVGVLPNGDRWLAPTNWVHPTEKQSVWDGIEQMIRLDEKSALSGDEG